MLTLCVIALPPVTLGAALAYHVYLDRRHVPNLETFIRFDLPMIGEVRDARGHVLIEMAHQYWRVVSYDEVPLILRQAILASFRTVVAVSPFERPPSGRASGEPGRGSRLLSF